MFPATPAAPVQLLLTPRRDMGMIEDRDPTATSLHTVVRKTTIGTVRKTAIGTLGALALLLPLATAAAAAAIVRCVQGTVAPPPKCLTYRDVYRAQADSDPSDEVRIYGIVPVPQTLIVRARKMTGVTVGGVRGTLDGRNNPGVVVSVTNLVSSLRLEHLDILTSGKPDGIGVEFRQSGLVLTHGLSVIGPRGGEGIGIDLHPGVGRVTMHGRVHESLISGQDIGIRASGVVGRPSPNGLEISDVRVGIQSIAVPLAQWFGTTIRCGRPGSIGFHSVAEHADHNGLDIARCSVGLQIECLEGVCGEGNEWDYMTISTAGCPEGTGCVPVRVITDDGPVDDYRADPNCGDVWGIGDVFDGRRIAKFAIRCPIGPAP